MRAAAPHRWTVRRVILAILGVQVGMAVILAGSDLLSTLPQLFSATPRPTLDTPIAPGDQTRRFRPADLPGRTDRDLSDPVPLPDPGDMPSRLRFEALPDGRLLMTGTIAPGDAERFGAWLAENAAPETVRLHSPGGSVADALAIGRALRGAESATVMEPGDICFSACPYILSGGVARQVADGALVGVHQHYFGEATVLPAFLAVQDIQRGQAEVVGYLDEMGIDLRLMEPQLATPPDEIYILTREELVEFALVTPD